MKTIVLAAAVFVVSSAHATSGLSADLTGLVTKMRDRAKRELAHDVSQFWSHAADVVERGGASGRTAELFETLVTAPDTAVVRTSRSLRLTVPSPHAGVLYPINAAYEFWAATSLNHALLLGVPRVKDVVFARHLAQLPSLELLVEDDPVARAQAQMRTRILRRGWESWCVMVLPVVWEGVDPVLDHPANVRPSCAISDSGGVIVSYGKQHLEFSQQDLETAVGNSVLDGGTNRALPAAGQAAEVARDRKSDGTIFREAPPLVAKKASSQIRPRPRNHSGPRGVVKDSSKKLLPNRPPSSVRTIPLTIPAPATPAPLPAKPTVVALDWSVELVDKRCRPELFDTLARMRQTFQTSLLLYAVTADGLTRWDWESVEKRALPIVKPHREASIDSMRMTVTTLSKSPARFAHVYFLTRDPWMTTTTEAIDWREGQAKATKQEKEAQLATALGSTDLAAFELATKQIGIEIWQIGGDPLWPFTELVADKYRRVADASELPLQPDS